MDNSLFSLLDSFGLDEPSRIGERLASWRGEEFQRFFDAYSEAARKRPLVIRHSGSGTTDVFPDSASGTVPVPLIRQFCVYANRFYIHDPILSLESDFLTLDTNFIRVIRTKEREHRIAEFRKLATVTLAELLELRPLAEAGILHVSPTGIARDRPEPGAIYATDMYGPSGRLGGEGRIERPVLELAPGLADYVNEHLEILPVKFENGRPIALIGGEPRPTNAILVSFDDEAVPMIFCLSNVKVVEEDGKAALHMRFLFEPPEDDSDPDTFLNWVLGESQKYIKQRLSDLHVDLYLASTAGAHFLTSLPSSRDLATVNLAREPSTDPVLSTLLRLELPFLSGVSLGELAKARENEAAFNDFRVALDKAFREIDSLEGQERQRRLDEIVRDIIHAPLSRIDRRMSGLHRDVFIDAVLAVGTLVTTCISGGSTLLTLATIAAAAKALESYKKDKADQDKIREHPSFFYWEVTKAARNRSQKI